MNTPKVKICCISSVDEAQRAVSIGASAVGLVSAMPSGPGPISEDLIADIVATVPAGVSTFLLTSKQNAEEIVVQQKKTGANTLQLVDAVSIETYKTLRRKLPDVTLVQVIHVTGESSIAEAESVAPHVDMLLLDSGNPKLTVKELGGTGRTHDWSISRKIVDAVSIPVFLAGGLNSGNVRDAIEAVRPYGVDICSGVRSGGLLDDDKLKRFIDSIAGKK